MELETVQGLITINATLLAQVLHFLVLMFILNRLMFRPILKMIEERNTFVDGKKDEIEGLMRETHRLKEEFVQMENKGRADATKERTRQRVDGLAEVDKILSECRNEVASIKAKADKDIDSEIAKTKEKLKNEAAALADDILEKVIGRRIEA